MSYTDYSRSLISTEFTQIFRIFSSWLFSQVSIPFCQFNHTVSWQHNTRAHYLSTVDKMLWTVTKLNIRAHCVWTVNKLMSAVKKRNACAHRFSMSTVNKRNTVNKLLSTVSKFLSTVNKFLSTINKRLLSVNNRNTTCTH